MSKGYYKKEKETPKNQKGKKTMKKDNFGRNLVIIFVAIIGIAWLLMNGIVTYIGAHTATYEKYSLPSKIYKIYWEEPVEFVEGCEHDPYYKGEIIKINDVGEPLTTEVWMTSATGWYTWMYQDYENYWMEKTIVEYWK